MRVSCAVDGRLAREGEIDLFCCICSACAHMHAWDRIRKIEEHMIWTTSVHLLPVRLYSFGGVRPFILVSPSSLTPSPHEDEDSRL
jgi:hypothetical protein